MNFWELAKAYHFCVEQYIAGKMDTTVLMNGREWCINLRGPERKDERQLELLTDKAETGLMK